MAQSARDGHERIPLSRRLLKLITHNWWLKLLALVFAFVVWGFVLSEVNPKREITISDCAVEIRGAEALRERNLTLITPNDYSELARVRLLVPHNEMNRVNKGYLNVVADVSLIASEGEHRIVLRATTPAGEVVAITPDYIDVYIEQMEERIIPIELKLLGDVPDGYWHDAGHVMPDNIDIRGARSEVSQIAAAIVQIEMSNRMKSFSGALGIRYVDENGNIVNARSVSPSTSSIMTEVEIYPTKTLEIDALSAITGDDALGGDYELGKVTASPAQITVAAPQEVLDSLNHLDLEAVDITGATADVTASVGVILPEGVVYMPEDKVTVTAQVIELEKSVVFENIPIYVYPPPSGEKSRMLPVRAQVTITGQAHDISAFTRDDILLYVETSGLENGTHLAQVRIRVKNAEPVRAEVFPATVEVSVDRGGE